MKTAIHSSNKKGYVAPKNAVNHSQRQMINPVSEQNATFGSPAMPHMPKPVDNFSSGETGHKVEVAQTEYINKRNSQ